MIGERRSVSGAVKSGSIWRGPFHLPSRRTAAVGITPVQATRQFSNRATARVTLSCNMGRAGVFLPRRNPLHEPERFPPPAGVELGQSVHQPAPAPSQFVIVVFVLLTFVGDRRGAVMSDSPVRPLISSFRYRCSDCGSESGFRSRRRTLTERFLLPLVFMRPVRCGECFRRDYRLIFTPVSERLSDAPRMLPGKPSVPSGRNVA